MLLAFLLQPKRSDQSDYEPGLGSAIGPRAIYRSDQELFRRRSEKVRLPTETPAMSRPNQSMGIQQDQSETAAPALTERTDRKHQNGGNWHHATES